MPIVKWPIPILLIGKLSFGINAVFIGTKSVTDYWPIIDAPLIKDAQNARAAGHFSGDCFRQLILVPLVVPK